MASSENHTLRAPTSNGVFFKDVPSTTEQRPKAGSPKDQCEDPPLFAFLFIVAEAFLYGVAGLIWKFLRYIGLMKEVRYSREYGNEGFAPLYTGFEPFYAHYLIYDTADTFNRPLRSAPGAQIEIMDREFTADYRDWKFTGKIIHAINTGSYDYLGFAQTTGACPDAVQRATEEYGTAVCSSQLELGTTEVHRNLEELVARFVRKPAAICFGMGFAANSMTIPTLFDKDCLIISDELNHSSIILGSRLSRAKITVFKHNDMDMLERKLRSAVVEGHPYTHRPYKKIVIMTEGFYSMEGTIVNLPEIVRLKRKYKAYLYIDEAHSVGSIGKSCRGVTDHFGVDTADVDVIMGTFTKSFASCGGFIAANEEVISLLRRESQAACYSPSMPIPLAQQVITSLQIIMGEDCTSDGRRRMALLVENTAYMRYHLKEMGFIIYGDDASPAIPLLTFKLWRTLTLSRMLLKRGVGVLVVGCPATTILRPRIRICVSASHTREMLDKILAEINEAGDHLKLKYKKK